MIAHARLLKFTVRRVGYKAKLATTVKTVIPSKAPAPAKKAPAKKVPATKTAAAKKVPVKKAVPPKPSTPKALAQPKAAVPALSAEAKTFARVKKAVLKMGAERPTKTKSLMRHVGAMLGQGSTAAQIDAVVTQLENERVVWVVGDAVMYPGTPTQ
jgi:hypothetical protein